MKKITVNQYTEVLYQATKDLAGQELNQALKNFVLLLVKKNDLKSADKIINKFPQVYNQHQGIEEVKVISHKRLSEEIYQQITSWLKRHLKKEILLAKEIDETLQGGYVIKYQDTILDHSLLTKLDHLKNYLLK